MEKGLRVAFFPDTYDEIDGVANTSRQFEAFAKRRGLPLLIIHGGTSDNTATDGSIVRITRRRGPIGFALDAKHDFDVLFWRHYAYVENAVRKFAPDFLHITGPSDVGQMGALIAHRLRIPLAASWHTNLHQYAERRSSAVVRLLPQSLRSRVGAQIRESSLAIILRFYRIAQVLFAPNRELIDVVAKGTRKPVYPMGRGVDAVLFTPERRERTDREFVIGYVGRLTIEKNVRLLAEVERALLASGFSNFRFSIVGQGAEEPWLRANLRKADFAGVLKGEALARAYSNMDAFLFPSHTDTFGNVVLEALASGVPAIVSDRGGPQFIVRDGETGYIARDVGEFAYRILYLAENPQKLQLMREAARADARRASWDAIFEGVYATYLQRLRTDPALPAGIRVRPQPTLVTPPVG
jgi:glycosyltransferase involved in cell wall biosynthesis